MLLGSQRERGLYPSSHVSSLHFLNGHHCQLLPHLAFFINPQLLVPWEQRRIPSFNLKEENKFLALTVVKKRLEEKKDLQGKDKDPNISLKLPTILKIMS